jgi:iron complex outermembrane receptor protein
MNFSAISSFHFSPSSDRLRESALWLENQILKSLFQAFIMQPRFTLPAIILLLLWPPVAKAQTYGEIHGKVIDAQNGEALPGANVQLLGTTRGGGTDANGAFVIKRIAPGAYTLRASFIGYQTLHAIVQIAADSVTYKNFALVPSTLEVAEVVVTASRQPEEIQSAVVSVSALTGPEALRRNSLRIDAALESVPGVNLVNENVNVRNSTGYTRGLGSRVLVLLDGIPALPSDFGNMNWDLLPITDVERIEIIKGPASALYGSFALGGVINIITKAPQPQGRFAIRSSAGIYDKSYEPEWRWTGRTLNFNRTDVSYSRQLGKLGLRFSLGRHESTGDRQNRHFNRWNFTGKLTRAFANQSELLLFGAYSRDRRGEFVQSRLEHPYLVPQEFLAYRIALDAYTFYLQYRRPLNEWLEMKARVSLVRQLTGNQFNVASDFKPAQGPGADWQIHARLDSSLSFTLGLEFHYDFAEQRDIGRHSSYTVSPYVQQIWQPHWRWRVTAGLRYDHFYLLPGPKEFTHFFRRIRPVRNPLSDGKEEQYLSPQLGGSYQLFEQTVLHAALGRGIRIPVFGERFLQFEQPLQFFPNPNLRTERSFSFELGLRQRLGGYANLEATTFYNTYRELIEPVSKPNASGTLVNIPRARIRGIETSGRFRFWRERIRLEASATWTEPMITETAIVEGKRFKEGALLSYRPSWVAYLSPSLTFGPISFEADYGYASVLKREQVQFFPDDQRVPKKQLDVRVLYRWQEFTAQVAVRNLLNYTYTQVERNVNEVRNFAVGMMWEYY